MNNTMTFAHGIHPEEYKNLSDQRPIERMPFVDEYSIPLNQHIGAPAIPVVIKGEKVRRGQMIAEPDGYVSVAIHSPVDGTVTAIDLMEDPSGKMVPTISIKTDPFSPQHLRQELPGDPAEMSEEDFIRSVQMAGIVGLGGAAFPAHVKFAIPEDKNCRYFMLNGCECEPFLTADHRTMVEMPDALLDGVDILQRFLQPEKIFIGIEANKQDAIEILREKTESIDLPIEVVAFDVKYPQGAEKMMISAILGKEVPSGKLPLDVDTLVSNVGTIAAISQWFRKGQPLIERVVTLTGTAVKRPSNLMVPIGTPMRQVVEYCGGLTDEAARLLLGGPMMGMVQKTLDTPVIKGTSGILMLSPGEVQELDQYNCIRCGRCVDACPMFLNPSLLGMMAKKGLWEEMEEHHVLDCFECGSCSFVCPSGIPLVQSFRVAKSIIRERQ